jgi:cellulose synthase operon protein B
MSRLSGTVVAALIAVLVPAAAQAQKFQRAAAVATPAALTLDAAKPAGNPLTTITLGDLGYASGFRFSNLGGRQEIFLPLPPSADLTASEITLSLDDVSAHEARRSLEILVNDRSAAAIALDGKTLGRQVRVPLQRAKGHAGFFKLTFVYSGAATQDRCIDVRSIGDSLTVRPESAIEIEIGSRPLDVATTAALMPRNVAIVLSSRTLGSADLAGALTIGRALRATGRRVSFHHGFDNIGELARRDDARRWSQGLILIGDPQEMSQFIDSPTARVAGPPQAIGTLTAARAAGLPAIVVSDSDTVRAARLLASSLLPALRGVPTATVGESTKNKVPATRVTFDELQLAPAVAEVFGRADITFSIATRGLPAGTRPSRLTLDMMVAPDGAGEKAVASVFVDDRLLASAVAAVGEPTRFDLALPDGLVGTMMNVRIVLQRRSAQGDCRFEPQGYPAQVLGSSALVLADAAGAPHDFADLSAFWANGVEVWLPSPAVERPGPVMGLVADTLAALTTDAAPISVKFSGSADAPSPGAPFIAVSSRAPAGSSPRVRFDRGRVVVTDRNSKTLLDVGGFSSGAVMQIVSASGQPGLWLKPLGADGSLPAPDELKLDRGDVAFVDPSGVALAMSSERDTLVRIAYPDQVSWLTVAERFHPWVIGAIWALVTVGFLFGLQRMLRRRGAGTGE